MGFADRYISAIGSSNLLDDALHHQTEPLAAAALAGDIGALLCRVKYADGTLAKMFEGNAGNLAQLLRIWTAEVIRRGQTRRWVPANTAWDAQAAQALDLPAVNYDEAGFRYALNADAMATEKLAEGIRAFAADTVKLEQLMLAH